jgi:DNA (cytosine-5)-methyltransferase 1
MPSNTTTDFDILVGGTPCQAFSIAGLREGLRDERSNLALEFVRILIDKRPNWFVWENVPGVLTSGTDTEGDEEREDEEESGSSSDFACLLSAFTGRNIAAQEFEKEGVIEGEFYSIAWRILDSQWFGVPQRRRRIFVVGHLGKDWRPPFAVLFEQDGLRRDFTPGGKKRKTTAGDTQDGTGKSGKSGGMINSLPNGITGTVSKKWSKGTGGPAGDECYNLIVPNPEDIKSAFTLGGFAQYKEGIGTLKKNGGDLGGGSETLVVHP